MKENEKNISSCPVNIALEVIGGKWTLLIVKEIGLGKRRFGELKRLIPAISEKMLIQELKKLTLSEMLIRKAYPEIPPRVEYSLSEYGKKILPVISSIKVFGGILLEKNK